MSKRIFLVVTAVCLLVSSVDAQRVTDGLVVGYDFREGSGTTVGDQSGTGAPLDLTIHDPAAVTWGAGFITLDESTIISTASGPNVDPEGSATKISDAIIASNEITIEAWLNPLSDTDNGGPARAVTMSVDSANRNFTLGQNQTSWQTRVRTTDAGSNGSTLRLETSDPVALELQHLVYTKAASGDAKTYVNGIEASLLPGGSGSGPVTGDTSNWDTSYDFALGNELTWTDVAQRDWLGDLYLVAVYDRALSAEDVTLNYEAGPAASIPEPSALALALIGLLGLVVRTTRRRAI